MDQNRLFEVGFQMTFGQVSIYVFLAPMPNAKARKVKVLEVSSGASLSQTVRDLWV